MNAEIAAVVIWVAIGAIAFIAGLAGIASTRRRLDGARPAEVVVAADATRVSVS